MGGEGVLGPEEVLKRVLKTPGCARGGGGGGGKGKGRRRGGGGEEEGEEKRGEVQKWVQREGGEQYAGTSENSGVGDTGD